MFVKCVCKINLKIIMGSRRHNADRQNNMSSLIWHCEVVRAFFHYLHIYIYTYI